MFELSVEGIERPTVTPDNKQPEITGFDRMVRDPHARQPKLNLGDVSLVAVVDITEAPQPTTEVEDDAGLVNHRYRLDGSSRFFRRKDAVIGCQREDRAVRLSQLEPSPGAVLEVAVERLLPEWPEWAQRSRKFDGEQDKPCYQLAVVRDGSASSDKFFYIDAVTMRRAVDEGLWSEITTSEEDYSAS